jgi:peptidoglycan/LPS O-acetylase OafA/YrhL
MQQPPDSDRPAFREAAQALEAAAGGDFGAFDGLRGVLALWVALGHICLGTTLSNNLGNAFAMPAFFIMSGCGGASTRRQLQPVVRASDSF